jgi:hypothetical protein
MSLNHREKLKEFMRLLDDQDEDSSFFVEVQAPQRNVTIGQAWVNLILPKSRLLS